MRNKFQFNNIRLFEKRGAIYSSRMPNYIGELAAGGPDTHILMSRYGTSWRQQRKVMQGLLSTTEVDKVLPIQNAEAISTVYLILKEPQGWYNHIRRYSTAVILATVFGQRGLRYESKMVRDLYDVQDRFNTLLEVNSNPPVDAFPILRYLPEKFASWKKECREIRERQDILYVGLLNATKQKIREGEVNCFMARMISTQPSHGLDDVAMARLGGVFVSDSPLSMKLNS